MIRASETDTSPIDSHTSSVTVCDRTEMTTDEKQNETPPEPAVSKEAGVVELHDHGMWDAVIPHHPC